MTAKERHRTGFDLQPIFYRCKLDREVTAEAGPAAFEIQPGGSGLQGNGYSGYRVKRRLDKIRLSIGDLAKGTGTKVVTVRYYEQIGLMPAPSLTEGNYRTYRSENMRRIRFIRRCRDLGFTLDQVRALLRLSSRKDE